MTQPLHMLAFSGSLRKASFNTRMLHIAKDMLPEGVELDIVSLADIPLYNEDVRLNGYPEPVAEFRQKIRQADALLIASPEYNYSVTGVLKNALDWASKPELNEPPTAPFPLWGKPFGMVSVAGRIGGARSQLALRQIAVFLNMFPVNKPEVLVSNFPTPAFDPDGNLTDPMAQKFLADLLLNLRNLALQLKK